MSKLTREQRIEIYVRWKDGESKSSLSEQYNINKSRVEYLVRLVDYHGLDILRKDKNNYYSPALKKEIVDRVLLNNQSLISTAIEFGLPGKGLLSRWIKLYKENGCVIVEKKRGRSSTMTKENKADKKYEDMIPEEKVMYLENKNLYLEAENQYLKKLRAVVQKRKNQQHKKK